MDDQRLSAGFCDDPIAAPDQRPQRPTVRYWTVWTHWTQEFGPDLAGNANTARLIHQTVQRLGSSG